MSGAGLRVSPDLELPLEFATEAWAILARRGAGKSNAGVVIAEELYRNGLPFVAIDPKGDWWGIRSNAAGDGDGLAVPVFGGRHGDLPLEAHAGAVLADLVLGDQGSYLSCVLDVSEFSKAEARRFLHDFADRLFRHKDESGVLTLIFEEAHEYLPQRVGRDEAQLVNVFQRIVKQGRQRGLGCGMLTQRSASLNKDVLTQVGALIPMWIMSPQDRAAIKEWVEVGGEARELIASLHDLKPGEAWIWWPEHFDGQRRFMFHRRWTFDSGATPKPGEARPVPRTLADVDLAAVKDAMAETLERAQAEDPKLLRARVRDLERELHAARNAQPEPIVERVEVPVLTDADRTLVARAIEQWDDAYDDAVSAVNTLRTALEWASVEAQPPPLPPRVPHAEPTQKREVPAPRPTGEPGHLRAGARRMVESLGRMYPLRLTTSQWGMVAHLKTTGGTWSTYLSDLRRAGLVQQDTAGWQLTDAGFDYIGGRPKPMTGLELQDHYRTILRAGAGNMMTALIAVWPDGLTREQLGQRVGIVTSGGTFSTYLSELVRNGLAERRGDQIVATDLLVRGADA